jgi:hypothetical protein
MQKIANYKKCSLDARARERTDGQGYTAEVYVRQPDGDSDVVTPFNLKETFPSAEAAIEAALQAGRYKVDVGFEPKSIV